MTHRVLLLMYLADLLNCHEEFSNFCDIRDSENETSNSTGDFETRSLDITLPLDVASEPFLEFVANQIN